MADHHANNQTILTGITGMHLCGIINEVQIINGSVFQKFMPITKLFDYPIYD